MLDDFAAKNHEVFDPTADENKLEYTVLHQQYQQMLEATRSSARTTTARAASRCSPA